jgi:hypothetical protein
MSRRMSGMGDAAADSLLGAAVVIAALLVIVSAIMLVALLKELWRIFQAHAFQNSRAGRILWGALAGLVGVLLICGLLAGNPATTSLSLVIASWSLFVFVVVCEVTDRYYRKQEPKLPDHLSLADVVSWQPIGAPTASGAANVTQNGKTNHAIPIH